MVVMVIVMVDTDIVMEAMITTVIVMVLVRTVMVIVMVETMLTRMNLLKVRKAMITKQDIFTTRTRQRGASCSPTTRSCCE